MTSEAVTVIAEMKAKKGKESELREALLALIPQTHAEEGCINYDLHESADTPGQFLFHENWKDSRSLEEHLAMPYIRGLVARSEELLEAPVKITLWKRSSDPKAAAIRKGF